MNKVHRVFLSLGGNLGERLDNLEETRMFILFNFGDIVNTSAVYETAPWQMDEGAPAFLNQVIEVLTTLTPAALMQEVAELENFYGRTRQPGKYLSREMDVDVLLIDDLVLEQGGLNIPHPRMHERRFVLVPMAEIAPDLMHPVLGKSMKQLLAECPDTTRVEKL